MSYNPIPPRVWSRVQSQCTYIVPDSSYNSAYIPLTGQTVSQAQADYEMQLFRKGNILQYKGNSSRLTKKQKYTQLAKCLGPNRTKVFATQSQTYTNPNTTGLLRVNYDSYPYPNQIVGAPNNISGPFQYNVPNPFDCSSNSIQDGGNLVCGTYANPCTGEIIQTGAVSATICNPASASNVPGSAILCWNNNIQTWFPRQRYIMNNSGTKWPQGYKGLVSAVSPDAPVLLTAIGDCGTVELTWAYVSKPCFPISNFNIYANGAFVATVPYTTTTFTVDNLNFNTTYTFYITSLSYKTESNASNFLSATTLPIPSPENLSATPGCGIVILNWTVTDVCSSSISNYFIYYSDGTFITSVPYPNTSAIISNLNFNTSYSFYVISYGEGSYSVLSNTVSATTFPLPNPENLSATPGCGIVTLNWTVAVLCSSSISNYFIYYSDGTFITSVPYPNTSAIISNLNFNTSYSFYVISYGEGSYSVPSNIVTTTTSSLNTPTLSISSYINNPSPGVILSFSPGSSGCTTTSYSYNLYTSLNDGSYTFINIPGNPSTYNVILSYNNIYNFYITYVASNGNESSQSTTVGPVNTSIVVPTNFTATGTSPTTGTLNWSSPSSQFVTSYSITGSTSGSTTATSYSLSGLSGNTPYLYNVVANYNLQSSFPASVNLTTYQYIDLTLAGGAYTTNVSYNSGPGTNYYYIFVPGSSYFNPVGNNDNIGAQYQFKTNYNFAPNYVISAGGGCGTSQAVGGGGGGVFNNVTPLHTFSPNTTYNISVGGFGAHGNSSASFDGGATGIGIGIDGRDGIGNFIFRITGGGGGQNGGIAGGGPNSYVNGNPYTPNNGGSGGINGTSAGYGTGGPLITLPFTITLSPGVSTDKLYLGGGGGCGNGSNMTTGYCGYGYGGAGSGAENTSPNKANANIGYRSNWIGSSPNDQPLTGLFFGGGGGGGPSKGDGSTGVVILYWSQ